MANYEKNSIFIKCFVTLYCIVVVSTTCILYIISRAWRAESNDSLRSSRPIFIHFTLSFTDRFEACEYLNTEKTRYDNVTCGLTASAPILL